MLDARIGIGSWQPWTRRASLHAMAGGDGDRDAGPARQPEDPDSPGSFSSAHAPVMPAEVVDFLQPAGGGLFVDATVGMGGHAEAILESSPGTRLLGIDRDAESLDMARRRLERFGERVTLVHSDHRRLPLVLEEQGLPRSGALAGLVADFGISSWQLAAPGRGFSFQRDEPLDMRMDRSGGATAARIVAEESEQELARIFFEYGEERHARRIARAIVRERGVRPVATTGALASLVERVNPRRGARIHPATRVFQALRIAVNQELKGVETFVLDSVEALQARGRLVLLTFHSLEDRLVKTTLRTLSHQCSCPRSLPRCACGHPDRVTLLSRKAVRPSPREVASNPRARSARLRAAQKI
ncbi:MAG TPA: 16S rRNA (cytosine(1402)-N(4))-methyltransferase RsmH [Candidatus Polarisedimenticolia bacterium]|nr:16S rRNA (cytosine(1402)-N(4))-methyltransferase RsmH [Candidatus Polarisedimenticolia bacterium]